MQNPFNRPHWAWITTLALQVIQAASLLPWMVMAGMAVMAFDAPDSTKRWEPWAFVLTIWSYPVWLLLGAVGSWLLLAFSRRKLGVGLALLMALPVPGLLLLILFRS